MGRPVRSREQPRHRLRTLRTLLAALLATLLAALLATLLAALLVSRRRLVARPRRQQRLGKLVALEEPRHVGTTQPQLRAQLAKPHLANLEQRRIRRRCHRLRRRRRRRRLLGRALVRALRRRLLLSARRPPHRLLLARRHTRRLRLRLLPDLLCAPGVALLLERLARRQLDELRLLEDAAVVDAPRRERLLELSHAHRLNLRLRLDALDPRRKLALLLALLLGVEAVLLLELPPQRAHRAHVLLRLLVVAQLRERSEALRAQLAPEAEALPVAVHQVVVVAAAPLLLGLHALRRRRRRARLGGGGRRDTLLLERFLALLLLFGLGGCSCSGGGATTAALTLAAWRLYSDLVVVVVVLLLLLLVHRLHRRSHYHRHHRLQLGRARQEGVVSAVCRDQLVERRVRLLVALGGGALLLLLPPRLVALRLPLHAQLLGARAPLARRPRHVPLHAHVAPLHVRHQRSHRLVETPARVAPRLLVGLLGGAAARAVGRGAHVVPVALGERAARGEALPRRVEAAHLLPSAPAAAEARQRPPRLAAAAAR